MSAQKYMFSLAFLAAVLLAVNFANGSIDYAAAGNKSHHLIVGYRLPGDKLVTKEFIQKNSSWMKVITLEKTLNVSSWQRITMIQALDQKTNGNGAYCSILQGGPGHNNVTLRFKSQRGHGINFVVELYAR